MNECLNANKTNKSLIKYFFKKKVLLEKNDINVQEVYDNLILGEVDDNKSSISPKINKIIKNAKILNKFNTYISENYSLNPINKSLTFLITTPTRFKTICLNYLVPKLFPISKI